MAVVGIINLISFDYIESFDLRARFFVPESMADLDSWVERLFSSVFGLQAAE